MLMQFDVASGKHKKRIEAAGFNQAAKFFLQSLLESEKELNVGELIHVSCITTEAYLHSGDLLKNLDNSMRIHEQ